MLIVNELPAPHYPEPVMDRVIAGLVVLGIERSPHQTQCDCCRRHLSTTVVFTDETGAILRVGLWCGSNILNRLAGMLEVPFPKLKGPLTICDIQQFRQLVQDRHDQCGDEATGEYLRRQKVALTQRARDTTHSSVRARAA